MVCVIVFNKSIHPYTRILCNDLAFYYIRNISFFKNKIYTRNVPVPVPSKLSLVTYEGDVSQRRATNEMTLPLYLLSKSAQVEKVFIKNFTSCEDND